MSSDAGGPPLVEVRGLVKRYRTGDKTVEVLRGIDLEVARGEMLAVVGASGAGKSTLLHILGTLERPTAGEVRLGGVEVFRLPEAELAAFRNRRIGFVFQFHHLLPEFTARENVAMPLLIAGTPRRLALARAARLLDEVGLGHRLDHRPGELSGGEQQRVALARALVHEPELVLADEPTGNLDEATAEEVQALLVELNERRGTTVLVVTHNARFAARMRRVLAMAHGRLAEAPAVASGPVRSGPAGRA
ncbi:MAG TPA: ABC transporter ATP-binding protein [Thermodesulfobacteriota bacterium]|nr:ABC transporter ATP-binding protein [Thermodesulfobacteriota bacterium]